MEIRKLGRWSVEMWGDEGDAGTLPHLSSLAAQFSSISSPHSFLPQHSPKARGLRSHGLKFPEQ